MIDNCIISFSFQSGLYQAFQSRWEGELSDCVSRHRWALPAHHVEEDDARAAHQWVNASLLYTSEKGQEFKFNDSSLLIPANIPENTH